MTWEIEGEVAKFAAVNLGKYVISVAGDNR